MIFVVLILLSFLGLNLYSKKRLRSIQRESEQTLLNNEIFLSYNLPGCDISTKVLTEVTRVVFLALDRWKIPFNWEEGLDRGYYRTTVHLTDPKSWMIQNPLKRFCPLWLFLFTRSNMKLELNITIDNRFLDSLEFEEATSVRKISIELNGDWSRGLMSKGVLEEMLLSIIAYSFSEGRHKDIVAIPSPLGESMLSKKQGISLIRIPDKYRFILPTNSIVEVSPGVYASSIDSRKTPTSLSIFCSNKLAQPLSDLKSNLEFIHNNSLSLYPGKLVEQEAIITEIAEDGGNLKESSCKVTAKPISTPKNSITRYEKRLVISYKKLQ